MSVVLLLAACGQAPEAVTPRLVLQPGDRWLIQEKNTSKLTVPEDGSRRTIESREAIDWAMRVDEGDAERGWNITMQWEKAVRDSTLAWDKAVDAVVLGKEFQFHMSSLGEVSDVRGLEALQEPVAAALDADEALAERQATGAVKEYYGKALSADGMRGYLERFFLFFPQGTVQTGDVFSVGVVVLPHQDFSISRTGRAVKPNARFINIAFRGDVTDLMEDAASHQQGTETGTALLNLETGQLQEVSREMKLTTESSVGQSEYSVSSNVVFIKQ